MEPEDDLGFGDLEALELPEPDEPDVSPVIERVNAVLSGGIAAGASHIHLDPTATGFRVRYRIDGALQEVEDIPARLQAGVTSRVKIMSSLDIAERRRPQDGKLTLGDVEARVAIHPTLHGERIVIAILSAERELIPLDALGLSATSLERFRAALAPREGLVLVAGSRRSGKTTTLYAALEHLKSPGLNIMTAEDPVAFALDGIGQSQVKEQVGFTWAAALRSMSRQDPDVIMVGSLRDPEAAALAARIALDGYLVLAGVEAGCACSALLAAGAAGAAARFVIAQRLVRRAGGRGRVPVCETLTVGPRVRAALGGEPDLEELRALALQEGLATFDDDARRQADEGRIAPTP